MKSKHFAGLDGLRFISITFVVLHHLFTFKTNFEFTGYDYPVLGLIGLYSIHFFFMGSGFLITYLLLTEYETYGRISLKNFYVRRVLRIWPAYYLLLLLVLVFLLKSSFFRIPGITDAYLAADYKKSNAFYFSFLPHLQPFFFPTGPYLHHSYTIGIEEQFYILWGLLFYFFRQWMRGFFISLLLACPLLNVAHYCIGNLPAVKTSGGLQLVNSAITYVQYSRFSTFAIGSLFGYAYFHQRGWIAVFKNAWVQIAVYALLAVSIAFKLTLPFLQNEYMAAVTGCVMLIGTFKKESLVNYSAGWISYLGKISYGIYLFHIIAIVLAVKAVKVFFKTESSLGVMLLLCFVTMVIATAFGYLSYHCLETVFLKIKRRFRSNPGA